MQTKDLNRGRRRRRWHDLAKDLKWENSVVLVRKVEERKKRYESWGRVFFREAQWKNLTSRIGGGGMGQSPSVNLLRSGSGAEEKTSGEDWRVE